MSEDDQSKPLRQRGSKLAQNEGRKLTATALNNAGLAFGLAAVLQPAVTLLEAGAPSHWRVILAALSWPCSASRSSLERSWLFGDWRIEMDPYLATILWMVAIGTVIFSFVGYLGWRIGRLGR